MSKLDAKRSTFEQTKVSFKSGELACVGYLYQPEDVTTPIPGLILANGFTNTMDWLLPGYAGRLVEIGLAVLIFDYRDFGESEGQPRQLASVKHQHEDIHAAIRFMRSQPGVDPDRIALCGTSLGGGHVFYVAVNDDRIASVITQVPGFDLLSKESGPTIKIPIMVKLKLLCAIFRDALQGLLSLPPYYVKVYGEPHETAVFTDPKLKPRFERLMEGSKTWRNAFTPRFYLGLPRYQPGTAERLKAPILVCVADGEVYSNPQFQAKIGHLAPHGEVRHYQGDHFDFYHDLFEQVIQDEIEFLSKHLL